MRLLPDGPAHPAAHPPMHGLVWAFAFGEDGEARVLSDEEAADRLAAHAGMLWLHFNLTDNRAREWIAAAAPICASARDILLSADPRQRLVAHDGEVAGIVSDFPIEFDRGDTFEMGRLRFALTERLIVSARQHPLRTLERMRGDLAAGRRIARPGLFLEAIVEGFLETTTETADAFADEFDAIEDRIITGERRVDEQRIGLIRRGALRLHREIAPLRGALQRIGAMLPETSEPTDLHQIVSASATRLVARLEAVDHDLHVLQDRARLIRDEIADMATAETNRHLYVLSVLTAVFLPATLITGVFGMNTKDLPFAQTDGGFWYSVAVAIVATSIVLLYLRGKKVFA